MIWATSIDALAIGGALSDEKNFICGNYKNGNYPSLDQQIISFITHKKVTKVVLSGEFCSFLAFSIKLRGFCSLSKLSQNILTIQYPI